MVTVRTVNTPQTQQAATPNTDIGLRVTGDDFGAGIGRAIQDVGGSIAKIADQHEQEKKRQNFANVNARLLDLDEHAAKTLRDPETGFLVSQGEDTLSRHGETINSFDKQVRELAGTIKDPEARAMFEEKARSRRLTYNGSVNTKTAGERDKLFEQTHEALQRNELLRMNDNYASPSYVELGVQTSMENERQYLDRAGISPESDIGKERLRGVAAQSYGSVIETAINNDAPELAKEYLNRDKVRDVLGSEKTDQMLNIANDRIMIKTTDALAGSQVSSMVRENNLDSEAYLDALRVGETTYGPESRAYAQYKTMLNGKLRDARKIKKEEIKRDGIDVSQNVTATLTLDAALIEANKSLPENRAAMVALAYSSKTNEAADVLLSEREAQSVIGSARIELYNDKVSEEEIDLKYPTLTNKQRDELRKFKRDVDTDDIEAKTWNAVNKSMKQKNQGKSVDGSLVENMYQSMKDHFIDHPPSDKEISDFIDLSRMNGVITETRTADGRLTGVRGGEMTYGEALAKGAAGEWIPSITDDNAHELWNLNTRDEQGRLIDLDPEGEVHPDDIEATLLRSQVYGIGAIGSNAHTRSIDKADALKDTARRIQNRTLRREKALNNLRSDAANEVSFTRNEQLIGMDAYRNELNKFADFGELPVWLETYLNTSGEIEKASHMIYNVDNGKSIKQKILETGEQVLSVASQER